MPIPPDHLAILPATVGSNVKNPHFWPAVIAWAGPVSILLFLLLAISVSRGTDGGWAAMGLLFFTVPVTLVLHIIALPVLVVVFIRSLFSGVPLSVIMKLALAYHSVIFVIVIIYFSLIVDLIQSVFRFSVLST